MDKALKQKLKVLESDITRIKKKCKKLQRECKYNQIGWRIKELTKLRRKATIMYRILHGYNDLKKVWNE